ncbi:lysophospholipase 1 [Nannizzia gypsea CBS 118893]|uniref:Lysophospholipase n=1 Tax=Arthroderma gypseum (strain ATCC MYA-4604 / CBS 118893) TaxID=535722 RepID=E4V5J5_ARTGP|nr:lysophospholipase 1 [Nannizzia gypsea CBS 118893]EFR05370.1 lysophospholipase 1 [Nannizzia gypsea CBS 118893]
MRFTPATLGAYVLANLLPVTVGAGIPNAAADVAARALPDAPDGYAPAEVDCPPKRPAVRSAANLSQHEQDWLKERRKKTTVAMADYFSRVKIDNFDAVSYLGNHSDDVAKLPNVAIAVSGGGYRALMNGAGALQAFDSRTENSTAPGQLGGLLQSATYLSGLSGGGWLVGSIYVNNDTTITDLQKGGKNSLWQFGRSILQGPSDVSTADYYKGMIKEISRKKAAGFETSITDIWGRALSFQLINATGGGPAYTWSSIAQNPQFQTADVPFPLLVADGRNPGEKLIGGNATIFEFGPYEFGTWDPTVFGFVPTRYIGSKFNAGTLPPNEKCVRGLDNAGFIMGTSSSLFNQFALHLDSQDLPKFVKDTLRDFLTTLDENNNDIADYKPNPFLGYSNNTSPFAKVESLPLVDGGEDNQNIPFHPLIQPTRNVDVIFAIDSSADTELAWPNGNSMIATYQRSLNTTGIANGTSFPSVPDNNTFINLGLNLNPTFFGCDSSNTTSPTPLIVYIPNSPYVTYSNVSTFDLKYNNTQRNAIILNGYNVATMGNATRDSTWPTCVGCAMLSRSLERTKTSVPAACKKCFERYCWDGKLNSTTPDVYAPKLFLMGVDLTSAAQGLYSSGKLSLVTAIAAFLAIMLV